jgi:hypothetical protein
MQSDYKVIETTSKESLETQVNYLLSQGWVLQGGVYITQTLTATIRVYSQALLKVN